MLLVLILLKIRGYIFFYNDLSFLTLHVYCTDKNRHLMNDVIDFMKGKGIGKINIFLIVIEIL